MKWKLNVSAAKFPVIMAGLNRLYILLLFLSLFQDGKGQSNDSVYARINKENEANRLKIEWLYSSVNELKIQSQNGRQRGYEKYVNAAYFLDAAISTCNNLQILLFKESYRNKITSLNNPASNELGFNLLSEIQIALKPMLEKSKHTDENKFMGVLGSIVNTGGKGMGLFTTSSLFGSILNMAGNLTVTEKKISKEDLDNFIKTIGKYFNEYDRLNHANFSFSVEIDKLKSKLKYCGEDIKSILSDILLATDRSINRNALKKMATEDIMLRYFNVYELKEKINGFPEGTRRDIPVDIIKSCKEINTSLQRLFEEYTLIYSNNYKEIKSIITETKSVFTTIDQDQLNKTLKELDGLYSESREADNNSLQFKTLALRLEQFILN